MGVKIGPVVRVVVVVEAMRVQGHGEVERLEGSGEGHDDKAEGQVKRDVLQQLR